MYVLAVLHDLVFTPLLGFSHTYVLFVYLSSRQASTMGAVYWSVQLGICTGSEEFRGLCLGDSPV